AIATPVASNTLSVIMYTAMNMMVEKKSIASLANTSFIVSSFGFRCISGFVAPSRRRNPVAVKAVGHPVPQLYERNGAGFDVGGIEDREVAAIFVGAPDHRQ